MRREHWSSDRIALAVIAVSMFPAGIQATLFPRSFFYDFPLDRGWIAHASDPYNEHLVRDVGALFLALIVATTWTVLRRGATRPIAAAWLVFGAIHCAYHAGHLGGFSTVDRIGLVTSLIMVPALAVVALRAGGRADR